MERCDEAVSAYLQALAINPSYLEARQNLTLSYQCMNLQDGAVKRGIEAISKNPGDPELHFKLARLFEGKKDLEKALQEYTIAAKLNENFALAYYHAAKILDQLLRAREAVTMCQRFVDVVRDPELEEERAWCLERIRQLQFR